MSKQTIIFFKNITEWTLNSLRHIFVFKTSSPQEFITLAPRKTWTTHFIKTRNFGESYFSFRINFGIIVTTTTSRWCVNNRGIVYPRHRYFFYVDMCVCSCCDCVTRTLSQNAKKVEFIFQVLCTTTRSTTAIRTTRMKKPSKHKQVAMVTVSAWYESVIRLILSQMIRIRMFVNVSAMDVCKRPIYAKMLNV